ncbi:heat shock protein 86 family protein, putative [Plasmodium ovale]|uniref:Heat shock protein 86 family protein, putative n=1 Tax=Plasmodium ovale TaxID=36330 RepID=A0A1C3KMI3_PLAOA|nr:heat shock protein 86 family protein, putative [Plasmodium ovale]
MNGEEKTSSRLEEAEATEEETTGNAGADNVSRGEIVDQTKKKEFEKKHMELKEKLKRLKNSNNGTSENNSDSGKNKNKHKDSLSKEDLLTEIKTSDNEKRFMELKEKLKKLKKSKNNKGNSNDEKRHLQEDDYNVHDKGEVALLCNTNGNEEKNILEKVEPQEGNNSDKRNSMASKKDKEKIRKELKKKLEKFKRENGISDYEKKTSDEKEVKQFSYKRSSSDVRHGDIVLRRSRSMDTRTKGDYANKRNRERSFSNGKEGRGKKRHRRSSDVSINSYGHLDEKSRRNLHNIKDKHYTHKTERVRDIRGRRSMSRSLSFSSSPSRYRRPYQKRLRPVGSSPYEKRERRVGHCSRDRRGIRSRSDGRTRIRSRSGGRTRIRSRSDGRTRIRSRSGGRTRIRSRSGGRTRIRSRSGGRTRIRSRSSGKTRIRGRVKRSSSSRRRSGESGCCGRRYNKRSRYDSDDSSDYDTYGGKRKNYAEKNYSVSSREKKRGTHNAGKEKYRRDEKGSRYLYNKKTGEKVEKKFYRVPLGYHTTKENWNNYTQWLQKKNDYRFGLPFEENKIFRSSKSLSLTTWEHIVDDSEGGDESGKKEERVNKGSKHRESEKKKTKKKAHQAENHEGTADQLPHDSSSLNASGSDDETGSKNSQKRGSTKRSGSSPVSSQGEEKIKKHNKVKKSKKEKQKEEKKRRERKNGKGENTPKEKKKKKGKSDKKGHKSKNKSKYEKKSKLKYGEKKKKKHSECSDSSGKNNTSITSATSLSFLCEGYNSLEEKPVKNVNITTGARKTEDSKASAGDAGESTEKEKTRKDSDVGEREESAERGGAQITDRECGDEKEEDRQFSVNSSDNESVGPKPLDVNVKLANQQIDYGVAMMPGEGQAIAQFVQKGKRIPRRGEVGLSAEAIENFENLGYVMSGSRHKKMNAIRMRKENQVYSAEEQRALAMFNYEERTNRENALINDLKEILRKQNEAILNENKNS